MIKEAIEKIVSLATPETFEIHGDSYTTNNNMKRIAPHIDQPEAITFSSLDAIVQTLKAEVDRPEITKPVFVNVHGHDFVSVFTTLRFDNLERDTIYEAKPILPRPFEAWSYHDDAIITLRSRFVQNEDIEYLIGLLSRISNDDSVTSEDNGVTQKVTAVKGVSLKTYEIPKTRVRLAPFRTFLEVEQPESEFLLRIKQGDKENNIQTQIGIIEADGGAWKLAAKHNIADYFREHLMSLIADNKVIVTE